MANDRSFGGKVGVVGSGKGLYVLSLFLMNIGLARSMGPDVFGSFQQVFILSAFFMILCMGIPETLYFFMPRLTPEERPAFLGQTMLLLVITGTIAAVALWFGAPKIAELQGNPAIEPSIRLFGIYGAFLIVTSFIDPLLINFKKLQYHFVLSGVHGLFFVALTIWQFATKSSLPTLFGIMAVFGVAKLLLVVIVLFLVRADIGRVSFFGGQRSILLQLMFSLPIALSTTVEVFSRYLDKFVVSVYLGPEMLGIFYIGAIEIPLVSVLLSSVYSVASPVLNKLYHENEIEAFTAFVNKILKFTAKIIWPVFIYLMFFANHLISLLFESGYEDAVLTFRIYLIMMPLRIALYGVILIALGKPKYVLWSSLGALAVNFVLSLVFIQTIGFNGPAIATVISTYLHVIVLVILIIKMLGAKFFDLVPIRSMVDIGLSGCIAAMVAFFLTRYLANEISIVFLSLSIFLGGYVFLGSKAGFIRIMSFTEFVDGALGGKKSDK